MKVPPPCDFIKDDIQHLSMRMWRCGIITMVKMETGPLVEQLWFHGQW